MTCTVKGSYHLLEAIKAMFVDDVDKKKRRHGNTESRSGVTWIRTGTVLGKVMNMGWRRRTPRGARDPKVI